MKQILLINGSASSNSANQKILEYIQNGLQDFSFDASVDLKLLPHFDAELTLENPPALIVELRDKIFRSDGVIICTPEYVFSIPSGLKNLIEWCVATVVLTDKPTGLITASSDGTKGHEELQMLMRTIMARIDDATTLHIRGIKSKVAADGRIIDDQTKMKLESFSAAFKQQLIDAPVKK
jgi:chromate reductase